MYKYKEITEVKWINGSSNPTDLIAKGKASTALKKLIDTNYLELQAMEWVERKDIWYKEIQLIRIFYTRYRKL